MAERYRETNLSPDFAARPFMVGTPTMNRYQNPDGSPGPFVDMANNTLGALEREGRSDKTALIVWDASSGPNIEHVRQAALEQAVAGVADHSTIYVVTPRHRAEVAQYVRERTGLRQEIVGGMFTDTGYGPQRFGLDSLIAAGVMINGTPVRVLGQDDDTRIPQRYGVLQDRAMQEGLHRKPNSQVLMADVGNGLSTDKFDIRENNRIGPFFDHLGKTVSQLKQEDPGMPVAYSLQDTLSPLLESVMEGHSAQFVPDLANPEGSPDLENATIIGATTVKSGMPDLPSRLVTKMLIKSDLPASAEELDLKSYVSGDTSMFAYHTGSSVYVVDSAAFARLIDTNTALWPWWFVSSLDISLKNPLQTTRTHYRAENDGTAVLNHIVLRDTGKPFVYLSGIDTQVQHSRAGVGYRPMVYEQMVSAMVGSIAADQAAQRLYFDPLAGKASMYLVDRDYQAPANRIERVFSEIRTVADMCGARILELHDESDKETSQERLADLRNRIIKFGKMREDLLGKIGDSNLELFRHHLNEEIGRQLQFYADVLNAMPTAIEVSQELIQQGKYPVSIFEKQAA